MNECNHARIEYLRITKCNEMMNEQGLMKDDEWHIKTSENNLDMKIKTIKCYKDELDARISLCVKAEHDVTL